MSRFTSRSFGKPPMNPANLLASSPLPRRIFSGISLAHGLLGLAGTAALALVWWRKSELEERVLAARFAGYAGYRARVRRRFFPWVL